MSTAETHPDVDELAEHAEGLLDATAAARVAAHLAECADCRARAAALDRVAEALRAAPAAGMPQEVAARIDAALAAAPAPQSARRSRFADRRVLGAAAVVVLLVAGVVVGFLTGGGGSSSGKNATSAGAGSSGSFTQTASGRDYDATTLASALPALLGGPAGAGGAAAPSPALPEHGAAGTTGTGSEAAPMRAPTSEPPISRLTQPAALLDCVSNLAPHTVPLAVDIARFAGRPAAVIVLPSPGHPQDVDVWVVGASCSHADDDLIYWARLPRPGG